MLIKSVIDEYFSWIKAYNMIIAKSDVKYDE